MSDAVYVQNKVSSWAGGIHLVSMLASWCTAFFVGFGGMITGLLMWFLQEDKKGLVAQNAAEVFNQHFSLFVYFVCSLVFAVATLGIGFLFVIPFWIVLAVMWFVVCINSARRGFDGEVYKAPFVLRVIK